MTVSEAFAAAARAHPHEIALRWRDGSLTYAALATRVERAAQGLRGAGVTAGDRVGLALGNVAAFPVSLLAIMRVGAVPVVFSTAWHAEDRARAIRHAELTLLIDDERLMLVEGAADNLPPQPLRGLDDVASILYSSGTTEQPRGVMLSEGNLLFTARAKQRLCGIAAGERLALVVPASHCFGQNVVLLGALTCGATVQLYPRLDAEALACDIADGHVTRLFAAPPAFRRLLNVRNPERLRRLRYALSAAAPLHQALADEWQAVTGVALEQGYGLTESSPFAAYTYGETADAQVVGRAIEGVEIRVDAHEPDATGELLVRGPNVMRGYFRDDSRTRTTIVEGWLRTGDIGRVDARGWITLVDRLDDMINVGGFKVCPSDVERALLSHPDVCDAAAYGVADAARGASVAATVVLAPGARGTASDVLAHAAGRLASYQRPLAISLAAELPRSPSGKVLRRALSASGAPPAIAGAWQSATR